MEFVCPLCKGPLQERMDAYFCERDQRAYRIMHGIPDFRVFPDPYIEFAAEDQKVMRLMAEYPKRTFAELVEFYYRITPDVSPTLAQKYMRYVASGVARAQGALDEIQQQSPCSLRGAFLEIGCGTGGFLIAARQKFGQVIGLDIALRWLIMAKKRLEETGCQATLVCACAEYLPFADDSFQLVVASDVIEHTKGQGELVREAYRVLAPGGTLFLATPNRWSLAPDPHLRLWGLGYLPTALRDPYARLVRRMPYRHISTLNYFEAQRLILQTNFRQWQILLPEFHPEHLAGLSAWERAAARIYHALKGLPLFKWFMYLYGPMFHIICVKTARNELREIRGN